GSNTSFRSILYTSLYLTESKDYELGESYFWSFTTIISNIFGLENHPSTQYTNPSEWLGLKYDKHQMEIGNGFGFSIIAESYYNFGLIGVVFIMFLVGYLINKYQISVIINNNLYYAVIIAIISHNFFWSVRNIAQSVVRPIAWEIIVLLIGIMIYRFLSQKPRVLKPKSTH